MSRKSILIIDDEKTSVEPLMDSLRYKYGTDICTYFDDGIDGVKELSESPHLFCCVILDMMFPIDDEAMLEIDNTYQPKDDDRTESGLIILKLVRDNFKIDIPVLCFTIRSEDTIISQIKGFKNTWYIHKGDSSPTNSIISIIDSDFKLKR